MMTADSTMALLAACWPAADESGTDMAVDVELSKPAAAELDAATHTHTQ